MYISILCKGIVRNVPQHLHINRGSRAFPTRIGNRGRNANSNHSTAFLLTQLIEIGCNRSKLRTCAIYAFYVSDTAWKDRKSLP